MTKKVTIIVLNYNGTADTLACLASLKHSDYRTYDVVLLDNASDDVHDLVMRVRNDFPDVKMLAIPQNRGFAGGNNVGIEHALAHGSDYILLLNNDTTVAPNFLTKLVEAGESDARIGIIGPKIYLANEQNRIWYAGGEFSWRRGALHARAEEIDRRQDDKSITQTIYMTGCALLIKTKVVRKIKMMPEQYFMYYEDIDWSLSTRKAGYTIVIANASHIWHKVSQSARALGEPVLQYYHIRNALLLAKRHAPPVARAGIYLWSIYFYIKQFAKIAFLPSTRPIATMIIRGIADFYRGAFGKYKP